MPKYKAGEEVKLLDKPWGFTEPIEKVKKCTYIKYTGGWGRNRYLIEIEDIDGNKTQHDVRERNIEPLHNINEWFEMEIKGTKKKA